MTTYGLNDIGHPVKLLQRALNEKLKLKLSCDGHLGKITQAAIGKYQNTLGIVEKDADGFCYSEKTQSALLPFIEKKYLTENDFVQAAKLLNVELGVVKAITEVEAKEFGFLPDGHPVILFERHKFYQFLAKRKGAVFAKTMAVSYGDICNPEAGGYEGGAEEVKRLTKASTIDQTCAMLSTSYGLFQLMGFNHKACGYDIVNDFVDAMKRSEREQMLAFVNLVKSDNELHVAMKKKDWAEIAKQFNGAAYAKNKYDTKLAAAYVSFKG